MNRFELICQYCNHSWDVNYAPQDIVYCKICKDPNIRVIDRAVEKIDYYMGAKPFPEKYEKTWDL